MSSIAVSQMGGLGDLVLTSQLITSLRLSYPQAEIVLVCPVSNAELAGMFPNPPDRVIPLDFNPYRWMAPTAELLDELRNQFRKLEPIQAGMFIAAEYHPTWFDSILASTFQVSKAVCASGDPADGFSLEPILEEFRLDPVIWTGPAVPADAHQQARYSALIEFLGGTVVPFPDWPLPEEAKERATAFLAEQGIGWGQYLLCFPLGAAGVPQKRWPATNFASIINSQREAEPLSVLITGTQSERSELESLAGSIRVTPGPVSVFCGGFESLQMLCALVAGAKAYVGNDTGPMHIASAYRVPGVAIYGGGHWPAYAPWGRGSIGIVNELPCFGCDWDCLFGHAMCIEAIPVPAVRDALAEALHAPPESAEIRAVHTVAETVFPIISDANRRYRESQADRAKRYQGLMEMSRVAAAQKAIVEDLTRIAAERLEGLEEQNRAYQTLEADAERRRVNLDEMTRQVGLRDRRIAELEVESAQRLQAMQVESDAVLSLRQESQKRKAALEQAASALAARDKEIEQLRETAANRLEALQKADAAFKRVAAEAEKRSADVNTLTSIVEKRDGRITELQQLADERLTCLESLNRVLERVQADAETRRRGLEELTGVIQKRDDEVTRLRKVADDRLSALEETTRAVETLRSETAEHLDAISRLTEMVRAKDQDIETANQVAQERLAALEQLAKAAEELRSEGEKRIEAMKELTAILAARDLRIAEVETTAEERLKALEAMDAAVGQLRKESAERLEAISSLTRAIQDAEARAVQATMDKDALEHWQREAARRLDALNELASVVAARDSHIAQLEQALRERAGERDRRERLEHDHQSALDRIKILEKETEQLGRLVQRDKREMEILDTQIIALQHENLYNFLVRRYSAGRRRPASRSQNR